MSDENEDLKKAGLLPNFLIYKNENGKPGQIVHNAIVLQFKKKIDRKGIRAWASAMLADGNEEVYREVQEMLAEYTGRKWRHADGQIITKNEDGCYYFVTNSCVKSRLFEDVANFMLRDSAWQEFK